MIDAPNSIQTKLSSEAFRFAWLVDVAGTLFLTDFDRDLSFSGQTYRSQGDILTLSPIVRERGIKLQSYNVTLTGVDGYIPAVLGAGNWTGRDCTIYLAFPAADGALDETEVISLYKGTFHSWSQHESDRSSAVTVKITSPWSKPDLTAGRVTSNDNQTQNYAGDKFFEFAHEERTNLGWGGKA
ncbi:MULTISPECIES: baseplate hub protein [Kordiimonas]|jgi:hypothetical protein|uniref:baseplate hub domain-containing protein n=1 Tax=Kordiimonas TaxID=288021 RepID=UPI00257D70C6|nr:DUF2163 domain-containing protein [Kordiimonas sp. UBA4487]